MHTIRLLRHQRLVHDIHLFAFSRPSKFTWQAGQHVMMLLPNGENRPLTIITAPHEKELQFLTHCPITGTSFKQGLLKLHPGDQVQITEAAGSFRLPDDVSKAYLVAAGIGIGAYRAIVRDRLKRKLSLDLSVQYLAKAGEHIFKDEWSQLMAEHPEFHVRYINAGIKEAGALKFVEPEGSVPVLMSGIYTQATAEELAQADGTSVSQREEAEFMEQAKKLFDRSVS
jgi:ferredoxin-NADP reductase